MTSDESPVRLPARAHESDGDRPPERDAHLLAGPSGLFEKIRSHVPTTKGQSQVFERLIKAFLSEDPLFKERFGRVYLWSEWPGRRGEQDTGIDLVAEEREGGLCAVQCKFYGEGQYIGREDIDPFLVASARRPFTARIFVSTTERWSKNAEKVLADQIVAVQRIGVAELEASPFDWSRFDPAHPDQLPRRKPKRVRPHQQAAIADVLTGFEVTGRGKLIMACGTGKTFTALRIAEEFVPAGGTVLYCVPSISLLSQSLRQWTADATRPLHCLAVCSDSQVTRDSEDIHVYDLALPATTNPERIAEHAHIAGAQSEGEENPLVVVFSTYQSLDRVAEAQRKGAPTFDLVVADEAHRTTGSLAAEEGYSGFTMVHDADRLTARHRLYMTATPRLYSDRAKAKAKESDIVLCSMDDEALYGQELHYLGFGKSVEAGLLSDYRVIVLMVDEGFASEAAHGPLADEPRARSARRRRASSGAGAGFRNVAPHLTSSPTTRGRCAALWRSPRRSPLRSACAPHFPRWCARCGKKESGASSARRATSTARWARSSATSRFPGCARTRPRTLAGCSRTRAAFPKVSTYRRSTP